MLILHDGSEKLVTFMIAVLGLGSAIMAKDTDRIKTLVNYTKILGNDFEPKDIEELTKFMNSLGELIET